MRCKYFLLLFVLSFTGCGPSADSVEPKLADLPPLPHKPKSSVALIMDSAELQLSEEQRRALGEIEAILTTENETLVAELTIMERRHRTMAKRREQPSSGGPGGGMGGGGPGGGMGGGGPGGGMGGGGPGGGGGGMGGGGPRGGMRGGGPGGGMSGGGPGGGGGSKNGAKELPPDMADTMRRHVEQKAAIRAKRFELNQIALGDAWLLLSPEQQNIARTILEKHGREGPSRNMEEPVLAP